MDRSPKIRSLKRILVVDNDPVLVTSISDRLSDNGYEVVTADSVEQAYGTLACEVIHLAIVEICLGEDQANQAGTGFEVAKEISNLNIPCVIFTTCSDRENMQRVYKEISYHFLNKSEYDVNGLIYRVDQLFTEMQINFELRFEGSLDLETIATKIQFAGLDQDSQPSVDHIRYILQKLFYQEDIIYLSALPQSEGHKRSVLVGVRPKRKYGGANPKVVKLSTPAEISQEIADFRNIKPFWGGRQRVDLERGIARACQLGGLVYDLIGVEDLEGVRSFEDVFHARDSTRMTQLFSSFFDGTLKRVLVNAESDMMNLAKMYTEQLDLSPASLQSIVQTYPSRQKLQETYKITFDGLNGQTFTNPILWVQSLDFQKFDIRSRKCLCCGHLRTHNILVDNEGHFWLFNFTEVKESHALRYFAALETDIKFKLLRTINLADIHRFEERLLEPATLTAQSPAEPFGNHDLDHAYRVILELRQIAAGLLNLENTGKPEYYQALLFHTLDIMRLEDMADAKKDHALLSAALICDRLDGWNDKMVVNTPLQAEDDKTPIIEDPPPMMAGPGPVGWQTQLNRAIPFLLPTMGVLLLLLVVMRPFPLLQGATAFFILGAGSVALFWWAIQRFKPGLKELIVTMLYILLFAIIAFALLGLVSGDRAIDALLQFASNLFEFMEN